MTPPTTSIDHTFDATIGVEVKGETWACVEIPGSATLFGSLKPVRVDATVDEVSLPNVGLLPTGAGELMLSLNAQARKKLGKDIGDRVTVRLRSRDA